MTFILKIIHILLYCGDDSGARTCCSNFGLNSGPIHTSRVFCLGYETTFNQCSITGTYSPNGRLPLSNVGVECQQGECLYEIDY